MKTISKIILHNFKRFSHLEIDLDPTMNIFVGDNESGKSSILQAIDLVSRGSRYKVEEIGFDSLFSAHVITDFMSGERKVEMLPEMCVELYFPEQNDPFLYGRNNSKQSDCDGICMHCKPNSEYSEQIRNVLINPNGLFPFEFYEVVFYTFAGNSYNGYTKRLHTITIDNTCNHNTSYSMDEYVRAIFHSRLTTEQRVETKHKYHNHKFDFAKDVLSPFNDENYAFSLKNDSDCNLETDITIIKDGVSVDNKGTGMQCFIKTELSLSKMGDDIDVVLLEEPESHLSYTKMLKLIEIIRSTANRQLFVSTHNDLIASRIDLTKCVLLNSNDEHFVKLNQITDDTAKFFMKAPDNNLLQFVLAKKVILVEGDAEYILMEALYKNVTNEELKNSDISVIAVDGKCFKRYLEIAKVLGIRVAIITDNDHNYADNIAYGYDGYMNNEFENIRVFADELDDNYTFEVCLYKVNSNICDELFGGGRRTLTVQQYMLANKAEVAYKLLMEQATVIVVPDYIQQAILWVKG